MKLLAVTVASFLIIASVASARIGETLEQCEARYGKGSVGKDGEISFTKAGFTIQATFYEGKVDAIGVFKIERDVLGHPKEMSDTEVQTLLEANGGGKAWRKLNAVSMDKQWSNEDGSVMAFMKFTSNILIVSTRASLERGRAAMEAKEKSNLKGF